MPWHTHMYLGVAILEDLIIFLIFFYGIYLGVAILEDLVAERA